MRGGFKRQVVPGVRISEVDLEATREIRERVHEETQGRQFIEYLLVQSAPGDGVLYVKPWTVSFVEETTGEVLAEEPGL